MVLEWSGSGFVCLVMVLSYLIDSRSWIKLHFGLALCEIGARRSLAGGTRGGVSFKRIFSFCLFINAML